MNRLWRTAPERADKIDFFLTFSALSSDLSYIFMAFPENGVYNTPRLISERGTASQEDAL